MKTAHEAAIIADEIVTKIYELPFPKGTLSAMHKEINALEFWIADHILERSGQIFENWSGEWLDIEGLIIMKNIEQLKNMRNYYRNLPLSMFEAEDASEVLRHIKDLESAVFSYLLAYYTAKLGRDKRVKEE